MSSSEAYCSPGKNVNYERYKFFTHVQGSKSIDVYITELKGLFKQCEFLVIFMIV